MSGRILTAVSVAFILFAIYSWYETRTDEGFDINNAEVAYTGQEREVSSGVPSSPNQRPQPAVIVQEERAFDPLEQNHESAAMPERLRHPERMFGPGLNNEDVETAITAGNASKVTGESNQVFSPEFAQNGGLFMGEVTAHDVSLETHYSSI